MHVTVCQLCQATVPRRSPSQRYCEACSAQRDLERKKLWAREHPPSLEARQLKARTLCRQAEYAKEAGALVNARAKKTVVWDGSAGPDLLWQVSIVVPFSYAASKNHLFALRRQGHVALRRESRAIRDEITLRLRQALANHRVAHNKLWIDILVQKPDHRGDAVNVVDLVCDAIKAAVPVDDRWFCIRRLDWEIAKENPRLCLKVGQDTDVDCQVCSYCGQIQALIAFTRRKDAPLGIDRVCRACRKAGRQLAKQKTCLKCGNPFRSAGPANRICPPCQKAVARVSGCGAAESKTQRGEIRHDRDVVE